MNTPYPSVAFKLFLLVALALTAPIGNFLSVELFYGVEFIFGSIAVFAALTYLGPWAAILVAITGGLQTVQAWGHPIGLFTFTLEAVVVSLLYKRGWQNLVLNDLAFWLVVGIPIIWVAYPAFLGMSAEAVGLLALKQPLNGVFNALAAGILLYGISQVWGSEGRNWAEKSDKLAGLLFHGLLAIILVTGAIPIVLQGHYQRQTLLQDVEQTLSNQAQAIKDRMESSSASATAITSGETDIGTTSMPGFHYYLTDAAGAVLESNTSGAPRPECVNQRQLLLWEPDVDNPIMRAQRGIFCLSQPVEDTRATAITVETGSANYVQTLKHHSTREFLILAGTFSIGLLVAWALSRMVTVSLTRLTRVASETRNGVIVTDPGVRAVWANESFSRISGFSRKDIIGKNPGELLQGPETSTDTIDYMRQAIDQQQPFTVEILNYTRDRTPYWVEINCNPIYTKRGRLEGFIAVQTDITDRKEAQERLQHIAHFDPLTDLPNRELVSDRLRTAMSQAKRRGTMVGVAFVDLDGFKQVNDTLGHDAGDELLKTIATRLSGVLREGDTLGRIGGDEFVAILVDLDGRVDLGSALDRLGQAAAEPMVIRGASVAVSASVGATIYSNKTPIDADQLVRQADQAMYTAKLAGKNQFSIDMTDTASDVE